MVRRRSRVHGRRGRSRDRVGWVAHRKPLSAVRNPTPTAGSHPPLHAGCLKSHLGSDVRSSGLCLKPCSWETMNPGLFQQAERNLLESSHMPPPSFLMTKPCTSKENGEVLVAWKTRKGLLTHEGETLSLITVANCTNDLLSSNPVAPTTETLESLGAA